MKRVEWVAVIALLGAIGCGDDDGTTPPVDGGPVDTGVVADADTPDAPDVDGGETEDPRVVACRATLEARATAVAGMLPWAATDATEMVREGGNQALEADYAGRYRDDLATHPGCVPRDAYDGNVEFLISDNEATVAAGAPASIPGYPCAAKEYTQASEDTDKPIVILVHGNSASVSTYEEYGVAARAGSTITQAGSGFMFNIDATVREQLATKLVDAGYRVIGFDARTDLVASLEDFDADSSTGNAFRNIDHGWAVPMLQALIKAVMAQNPTRKVSLVGHSLGVTVIRDAIRRNWNESVAGEEGAINPFPQLQDVILLSGASHGVTSGQVLCDAFAHMRGTVGCEMGDRAAFAPTYFSRPLNGPSDYYGAPCADGDFAYGQTDQCGGNAVHYTTVTMRDIAEGMLQDEFISEASSQIDLEGCVENELIELSDYDASGYFFTALPGLFANHFGSVRSDAGMTLILEKLAD
ncbi:MAG: hypothetical protein H6723_16510 [Sandaracinus sp.]|nr:hypothetical protein [Sandaracinus sp.]